MRTLVAIWIISLVVVVSACKTTREVSDDVTGTYELKSIDGNPLPYAPEHLGGRQPTVTAGKLTLREGGAFAASMAYGNDDGRTTTRAFSGLYALDGESYLLEWQGAGRTRVTIEGDELTMNNEGMLFVYWKAESR